MMTLFIFAIIGRSLFYIVTIGLYVHYLQSCKYKKIRPLNYFDWLIGEDDRV